MQFLFPAFLIALASLLVPILIHLFYFRRFKKVYFTNVKFLKEVKEETSNRRKLRNLLVLISRLAALAFLVFAFAQPFIPKDNEMVKGNKSISVFIDNSFSMSALSQDVSLLEKAKIRAKQIVEAYSPEDDYQILTNDFEGRHQRLLGKDDALAMIENIKISPSVKEISKVVSRQKQTLTTSKNDNQISYIISDFQKSITDLENIADTSTQLNLIPLQSVQEKNVSIDSIWFMAPVQMLNQTNNLLVKIKNYGSEEAKSVRLSLNHNGQTKPVGLSNIPANASVVDTVPITILKTGWHRGELIITDFPIQFDDKYFFSFEVAEEINVLVLNEQNSSTYLDAAFKGLPYFKVFNQNARSIEYSKFPSYQLIVLNDLTNISSGLGSELVQFAKNGGNVLVFPSPNADLNSYNNFFQLFGADRFNGFVKSEKIVGDLNSKEFIFNDVFENKNKNLKLPSTQGNFNLLNAAASRSEQLLTYRDGNAYLKKYNFENGILYVSTAPLSTEYNDLVRNSEIFVPMVYKMAISGLKVQKISFTIGNGEVLESKVKINQTSGSELIYKLKGEKEEFIPVQRIISSKVFLTTGNELIDEGFYELNQNGNSEAIYAFNYDRKESNLEYLSISDLENSVQQSPAKINLLASNDNSNFTAYIGDINQGSTFWRWCLIIVLFFLAIEALLLRFWKV